MPLDEADRAAIAEMLKTSLSTALTAGLKPVLDRVGAVEAAAKASADARAKAEAEALAAKAKEKAEADKGKGKTDPEIDPALAAKLADLTAKLEASAARTTKAEAARAEAVMLQSLRTELGKAGIPADRMAQAVGWLHDTQGRIETNEAGAHVMVFDRTGAGGAYKDRPALADGVAEWLKSTDGMSYLPPVKVQGIDPVKHGSRFSHGGGKDEPIDMPGLRRAITGKFLELRKSGQGHITTLEDAA